jgi:hypothetical protein
MINNFSVFSDYAALKYDILSYAVNVNGSKVFNSEYIKLSYNAKELYRSGIIAKLSVLIDILLKMKCK